MGAFASKSFQCRSNDLSSKTLVFRLVPLLSLIISFFCIFGVPDTAHARKYASFVMEADTGKTLYSRNADTQTYPASLTKMMTLYLLFEDLKAHKISMRTPLKISARAARQPSSKLNLKRGSTISVHTAIKALVIKSANDVAVTVAENLARSEVSFARRMTRKARDLGMDNTTFRNASGLYHSKQVTTARDMATLGQALYRDFPEYYSFFSLKSFRYKGKTIRTHNKLLKTYSGADGMKTGYIRASGFNIVTSAERNNTRIISVVLGGESSKWRDRQVARLMNKAFQNIAFAANNIPRPPLNPENKRLLAEMDALEDPVQLAQADNGASALNTTMGEGDAEEQPEILTASLFPTARSTANVLRLPTTKPQQATKELNWGVQVGAFADASSAHQATQLAMAIQTESSAYSARRSIEPIRSGQRTLYRARLTQLTAQDASRTCRLLKRDNKPCMTLRNR